MNIIKKLSEVCKIVGVTRRTLQEYDRIELLKPTSKTKSGYWLYDNPAIQKLILIQIFVEVGYKRKTIKSLLESPTLDMLEELDHLIATLEKKHKRINGMINTIKIFKLAAGIPENTLHAMGNLDMAHIYKDKSFNSYLEDSILFSAEYNETENTEIELYMPFWYNIIAIGCLMRMPEDAEPVQSAVEAAYKDMIEIAMTNEANFDGELSEAELAKVFLEEMQGIVHDPELLQMVDLQCGDGAAAYIIRAVRVFSNKKRKIITSQKGDK